MPWIWIWKGKLGKEGGLWMAGLWHKYTGEADDRDTGAKPLSSDPGSLWHSDLDSFQGLLGWFENVLSDLSIVDGCPMIMRAVSPLVVSLTDGGGEAAQGDQLSQVGRVWAGGYTSVTLLCLPAHKSTRVFKCLNRIKPPHWQGVASSVAAEDGEPSFKSEARPQACGWSELITHPGKLEAVRTEWKAFLCISLPLLLKEFKPGWLSLCLCVFAKKDLT